MAGGELFEDIIRRSFYSEACARRVRVGAGRELLRCANAVERCYVFCRLVLVVLWVLFLGFFSVKHNSMTLAVSEIARYVKLLMPWFLHSRYS